MRGRRDACAAARFGAAARHPVRLGQHARRQLGDNSRSAQPGHGGDGQAGVDPRRDEGAGAAQPARSFSAISARAGRRRGRSTSSAFARSTSNGWPVVGPPRVARSRLAGEGIFLEVVSNKTGDVCVARPSISAGRAILARSSAPGTPPSISPTPDRSGWLWGRAGSRRGSRVVCRRYRRRHRVRGRRRLRAGTARGSSEPRRIYLVHAAFGFADPAALFEFMRGF